MFLSISLLFLYTLIARGAFAAPAESSIFAVPSASAVSSISGAPSGELTSSATRATSATATPSPTATSSVDPDDILWTPDATGINPEPIRGGKGATVLGPHNVPIELENADFFAPPATDNGKMPNFKWPFSLSRSRLSPAGWARAQNKDLMPSAKEIAGVNMRLKPGAIRELHWHLNAEWAYVLKGELRLSTVTPDGEVFIDDVSEGDIWYFPSGYPHTLHAKNTSADGVEFILIMDSGAFSEYSTFSLADWVAHTPKGVLAKNFGLQDLSLFDHIPTGELFIFSAPPPPDDISKDLVIPNNTPNPFSYKLSKAPSIAQPGGSIKVIDTRNFKVSTTISAVEVTVEVGGMRELHWHPTQPEWSYFIQGEARVTVFGAQSHANTVTYQAGDIGYVPPTFGHYVENIGNTTLKFLEVFKGGLVEDISLTQWLALTPQNLVKQHLHFDDETMKKLSTTKHQVVAGTKH